VSAEVDLPSFWRRSARAILEHRLRTVLVIGAPDRGKSTYCGFLARTLRAAGASVAFVDADVGQKDVGPPATITLARIEDEGPLSQARPVALYFVGDVDPARHFLPFTIGVRRAADAAQSEFVVIDMPGFVEGAGRALNAYQIESLRPAAIVALQAAHELEPILRAYAMHRIFRLRSSARATRKPREARRAVREQAFRAHFAIGRDVVLYLKRVAVQRARIFIGEPLDNARFPYAETTAEGVVAIGDTSKPAALGWRILPPDFADNLLCGVMSSSAECRGLGIIERIEFAPPRLRLFTPVPRGEIAALQFGDLYIDRHGRQLGRKQPGWF